LTKESSEAADAQKSAEQQPANKRRQLRKVETVRDRTAQAQVSAPEKSGVMHAMWRGFTWPVRILGRGLAKLGRGLNKIKVFHIIGLILWPPYFRNSWRELRQVTWPNGKQSRQLTLAVILFATIFGLLIAVLDFGLDKLFKQVLLK